MKKYCGLLFFLCVLIISCFVTAAAAQSDLEKFMRDFEPDYQTSGLTLFGGIDTSSPYTKPLRQLVTTDEGAVIMLDKVLVTEDKLTVSVLIGFDPNGGDWVTPDEVYLDLPVIEVEPLLPYPPDYFENPGGGGGGGPGYDFKVIHERPYVVYSSISTELMFYEGYVAVKDPIQVTVNILGYKTCWNIGGGDYPDMRCFQERGPWTFEFETDGAELAEKTKEFEIGKKFEIEGKSFSLDRLRFNPMHLIAFISGPGVDYRTPGYLDNLHVFIETDDRTAIHLWPHMYPYIGFDRQITDDVIIASLEKTKSLKVMFCLSDINGEFPSDYNPDKIKFYTCDPAWSTMVDLE